MLFFQYLPDKFQGLWELWSVEFLVLINFLFQSFLIFYGGSRKYKYKYKVRGLVWLAYLLSSKFAAVILGKLTVIPVDGDRRHTHSELLALLAPLVLMQIGNPDGITAYSMEDDDLGVRQILNLIIQIVIVIHILVRSWTSSLTLYLYLPMFLAGIIKYGETAWALITALACSPNTVLLFHKTKGLDYLMDKFNVGSQDTDYGRDAKLILIAYCRFFRLRPHLENWPYQALFKSKDDRFSIDNLPNEEIFRVTESELGFMYDVLYTKAPIVYSKTGGILRIISILSLIGTLCGFSALFKDVFVYHIGVGFINFVLAAPVILEIYQILLLPFSDWAIVMMIKHNKQSGGMLEKLLKILAPQSKRWRKWSNSIRQFNLLDFCLNSRKVKISRWTIFQYWGIDLMLRMLGSTRRISINKEVKDLVVSEMRKIDEKRRQRPFVEVGTWTMDRYGNMDDDVIKKIFGKSFEKCIITWHVATDIWYYNDTQGSQTERIEAIRVISNYMMFFLARRPNVLRTTTSVVLLDHIMNCAIEQIETQFINAPMNLFDASSIEALQTSRTKWKSDRFFHETPVTKGWLLQEDVRDLVEVLQRLEKTERWELIGSAWIEMMCYAAANSGMKYHAKHLWKGGELITHVWLLLAHNSHKYHDFNAEDKSDTPHLPTSAV